MLWGLRGHFNTEARCLSLYIHACPTDGSRDGEEETEDSFFFHEYKQKLIKIYDMLYTKRGREIAMERKAAAVAFYESLCREVDSAFRKGAARLDVTIQ